MATVDCDAISLNQIRLPHDRFCYQIPLPVRNARAHPQQSAATRMD